jgi:hypothetical protein
MQFFDLRGGEVKNKKPAGSELLLFPFFCFFFVCQEFNYSIAPHKYWATVYL